MRAIRLDIPTLPTTGPLRDVQRAIPRIRATATVQTGRKRRHPVRRPKVSTETERGSKWLFEIQLRARFCPPAGASTSCEKQQCPPSGALISLYCQTVPGTFSSFTFSAFTFSALAPFLLRRQPDDSANRESVERARGVGARERRIRCGRRALPDASRR